MSSNKLIKPAIFTLVFAMIVGLGVMLPTKSADAAVIEGSGSSSNNNLLRDLFILDSGGSGSLSGNNNFLRNLFLLRDGGIFNGNGNGSNNLLRDLFVIGGMDGGIFGGSGLSGSNSFLRNLFVLERSGSGTGVFNGGTGQGQVTVIVESGDTLSAIAREFNTTVSAIVQANNIANPDLIFPGQRLVIPTGSSGTTNGATGDNNLLSDLFILGGFDGGISGSNNFLRDLYILNRGSLN